MIKRLGLASRSDLNVLLAAVDSNLDGFLDYYELERLRHVCKDALEEHRSGLHPFRPWFKKYSRIGASTSMVSLSTLVSQESYASFYKPSFCSKLFRL